LFGKMDLKMRKIQNFQDSLDDFYREYNFSYEYYEHIREVVYLSLKKNIAGFNDMLDSLPFSVRTQLLLTMHSTNIACLSIFQKKPRDFILFLLPLLQPAKFKKDNILCSIEEILEEMFIVTKGVLSVTLGSKFDNIEIFRIQKNMNFGDVLFYMNLRCPYEVTCKLDAVELLILNKINFLNCKEKFNEQMLKVLEEDLKIMYKIETRRKVIVELHEFTKDTKHLIYCAEKIDSLILEENLESIIEGKFFEIEEVNYYSKYLNAQSIERIIRLHTGNTKKSSFFQMLDHLDKAAEKRVTVSGDTKFGSIKRFKKEDEKKLEEEDDNEENEEDDEQTKKAKQLKKKFIQQRELRTLIMGNINEMCAALKKKRKKTGFNSDEENELKKLEINEVAKNVLNYSLLNNGFEKLLKSKAKRNQLRRSFYSNTKVWTKLVTLFLDPLYVEIEEFEEMKKFKEIDALKDSKLNFIKKMINIDNKESKKAEKIEPKEDINKKKILKSNTQKISIKKSQSLMTTGSKFSYGGLCKLLIID